jgi:hypothetical protein
MIKTVKLQENGYLVDGTMSVPYDNSNRHYQEVQEWIAEGNTPEPIFTEAELLAQAKNSAKERIKNGFINALESGTFESNTLSIEVDNRRSAFHNDKDNLQSLINIGIYPINWKGTSASASLDAESDALSLKIEMEEDGVNKYKNKWVKEQEIADATDIAGYESINW